MKQVNRNLVKLAILGVAMCDSGNGATSPALGTIMAGMPDVAPSLVQMIVVVPSLFMALTPIVYAKLLDMGMKKRTLMYIGAATFIIGGVGPALLHSNIWVILVLRAILGIGNGICLPLSTDLVIDFFEGQERNTMQGFVSATVGLSGVVFQLLGGYFAGLNWTYTFYAYLIAILFFGVAFAFLPEPNRQEKMAAQEGITEVSARAKLPGKAYLVGFMVAYYMFFWVVMPTNGAPVLIMEGMATPAQIGGIFAMITVASFIMSVAFGWIFKAIKFALLPIAFLLSAAGMFLCYSTHNASTFTVGIFIYGMGLGCAMPTFVTKLSGLVPYSAGAAAISIAYVGLGVGQFIQPILFKYFGTYSFGRPSILLAAICLVVGAVIVFVVDKTTPAKYVSTEKIAAK
ncbi:MFS transporter [Dehalobacter sp. DCM]|uniref:MFS transporter n=1 Tax=Dehalobacter sp. DCM TaxID=2907827 RepID=UPI003081BA68|nr:MFS transporter [Dehalobacter sp. DCM]